MTTYTPTVSAAGRDWPAQLKADPTLWGQYGDWLSENEAEWRERQVSDAERRLVWVSPAGKQSASETIPQLKLPGWLPLLYGQLPAHQRPPYLAYLTGRLVGLLDERRHGVEMVNCQEIGRCLAPADCSAGPVDADTPLAVDDPCRPCQFRFGRHPASYASSRFLLDGAAQA